MLVEHKTHSIIDSSKTQTYMDCPRKYMFRYIFGWTSDSSNNHLIFGESYHRLMASLLKDGYNEKAIQVGFKDFMDYYRQHFSPETDDTFGAKTPATALQAGIDYINHYNTDRYKTIFIEVADKVPLVNNHPTHGDIYLCFRLDSILQDEHNQYVVMEHKTASRVDRSTTEKWTLSMQIGAYLHALYLLYPKEFVYGVMVNITVFKKTYSKGDKFIRVPVRRDIGSLENWYWNARQWVVNLLDDTKYLMDNQEKILDKPILECFRMNTENCSKYFGCLYRDLCIAWANPLQRYVDGEMPVGMKVEWWDPTEREGRRLFGNE